MGMALTKENRQSLENEAIRALVALIFNDDQKANLWMRTENPLLGGLRPVQMIAMGRFVKLLEFVTDSMRQGSG